MIRWYEQTLDWMIAHTSLEMAFCLFIVGICGMIAFAIWIVALTRQAKPLNSDIEIWEAIKSSRTPHTLQRPRYTKVTDSE